MTDAPPHDDPTCPAWCVLGMIYPCTLPAGHTEPHRSTGIHLEWAENND